MHTFNYQVIVILYPKCAVYFYTEKTPRKRGICLKNGTLEMCSGRRWEVDPIKWWETDLKIGGRWDFEVGSVKDRTRIYA